MVSSNPALVPNRRGTDQSSKLGSNVKPGAQSVMTLSKYILEFFVTVIMYCVGHGRNISRMFSTEITKI